MSDSLQELITRGRFLFSSAPLRLRIFSHVNGRNNAKIIARSAGKSLPNTLADLQKMKDAGLIEPKTKNGKVFKSDGSIVYQKVPLAKQIPIRYFNSPLSREKVATKTTVRGRRARSRIPKPLPFPSETEILTICSQGEDQIYEFKQSGVDANKIAREIAAFAHTPAGGLILYGVADNGEVKGSDMARQKFDQWIHNSIRNTILPSPKISIRPTKVLAMEIIVILVHPWNRKEVYFFQHVAQIRRGTNVFAAKPEEIKKLHMGQYII